MRGEHRLWRRAYFYIKTGDELPKPEVGVGHVPHDQTFTNIYVHGVSAPLDYEAGQFEEAVIDAGYDGYAMPDQGGMVLLDVKPIPVNPIERAGEHEEHEASVARTPLTRDEKRKLLGKELSDAMLDEEVDAIGANSIPIVKKRFQQLKYLQPQLRLLAEMGKNARGGYAEGADIVERLIGPQRMKLWALFNSAFSAQNSVAKHVATGLDMSLRYSRFIDDNQRLPTEKEAKELFWETVNATNGESVATTTVHWPKSWAVMQKGYDADFTDLKSTAKTNKTGHSIAKVPGFGRSSSGDVMQVVLDTYMARLIKPKVAGFKYVEGQTDREGNVLSREQQLKNKQKDWVSTGNNYLAYSARVRQIANELGLKVGEAQEQVWAAVYSILGLKNAGVPTSELTNEDIRAAWNLSEILLENEDVQDTLQRHGIGEDTLQRVRAQAAEIAAKHRPDLKGPLPANVLPSARRLSAGINPTGRTEGREVSKRHTGQVEDEGDVSFNVDEFSGSTASNEPAPEQNKAGMRRKIIYTKKRWAPWASSPTQTADGNRIAQLQKKPDTTVGERTVAEFLADSLSAMIVRTKSQLTKTSPGKYLGGVKDKNGKPLVAPFHHIWLRSESGYWHELGHALSSIFTHVDYKAYAKWKTFWEPALTQLSNSVNGFSSVPGSLEEGIAEAARLYITDQGRLDAIKLKNSAGKTISFLDGMEEILGKLAPEEHKALKDAHRLMAAHRQKPQAEQKKIHSRDKGYNPGTLGRRLREATRTGWEKVLAALYGDSATIDRIAAKAYETQSQTPQGGWHGIHGMWKLVSPFVGKAGRVAYRKSLDLAKQANAKLVGEIGDLKARYNTLARTGVEVQRILKGDEGQKGLRVMGTKDMLQKRFGKMWRVAIKRLKDVGIPMNFAESKEGGYYYFVDDNGKHVKSVAEIKEEIGQENWADFESYGKWKTVLHRYKIYERRKAQGKDVEEPLHPDWTEHPIYPEKNRPGASVDEMVAEYEQTHPEWVKSYKDVQLLMDGLLGMAVLSGEIDYNEARRIKRNHKNYWPLGRQQREGNGEGRLDPRDIAYDIKKQYGSDLPFNGLDEMLYGRVHKALSAYNYARLLESHIALTRAMAKLEPELRKKVEWMRSFIPLKVDMKVGAILTPDEEAKIVAERINTLEAMRMGIPLHQYLQQYGGVTPDDVRISSPGRILWREAAPNIQANVMSVTKGHKKKYYYVPSPLDVDIYTSQPHLLGDIPGLSATFEVLGRIIAPFKRIVTRSTPFAILNTFWRDPQTAMLSGQGKRSLIPYLYLARGVKAVVKRDILGTASPEELEALQETWSTFSKTSIPVNRSWASFKGMMSEGVTHIDGTPLKFYPSEVGFPEAAKSWAGAAVSTIMKPFDLVNWATGGWYLSPRGEALGRIGAYLDAMDNGRTQEQAIAAGDNSTANFNQRSKSRWINAVDKQAMFLNARMQVGWTFYRQLRDPDPRVRGLALMKLPYIAGMHSMMLASLYLAIHALGDEEDEKKLTEWLRNENERTDEDKLRFGSVPLMNIKVPFDDGLPGMFASMGWNATLKALNGDNPHQEALRIAGESAGNMGPVVSQWINPYVRTIMEIKMNYNFYHGEPIVPPGVSSLHEPRQQTLPSTPEFYNWFAENVANVSPLKLRHIVSNVGARALDQTLAFTDEKVPREGPSVPVFGSLFTKEPRGWSSQPVKELSELESQFDAAKKDLEKIAGSDPKRAEEAYARMQALAGYKAGWSAVEAIWRQAKAYRKAGKMDLAVQRERDMTAVARRLLLQAGEASQ